LWLRLPSDFRRAVGTFEYRKVSLSVNSGQRNDARWTSSVAYRSA